MAPKASRATRGNKTMTPAAPKATALDDVPLEGADTDDTDETGDEPDADDDTGDETPEVKLVIQWPSQLIEASAKSGEGEEQAQKRLISYASLIGGLDLGADSPEVKQGWAAVLASRAAEARNRALGVLGSKLKAYTLPDSLITLATEAKAVPNGGTTLVISIGADGKASITAGSGVSAPRMGGTSSGRPRGTRSGWSPGVAPAGVRGGAAGLLFDGQPVTSEMLRSDARLNGAEAYLNRNAAGKQMPNGTTYSEKMNMNAGQALLSFCKETGRESVRALVTKEAPGA